MNQIKDWIFYQKVSNMLYTYIAHTQKAAAQTGRKY